MVIGGNKTVAAAGTPVPLKSTRTGASWLKIQAKGANTDIIYVIGKSDNTSADGVELIPGGMVELHPDSGANTFDLALIYIDAAVNGEGVKFLYGDQ